MARKKKMVDTTNTVIEDSELAAFASSPFLKPNDVKDGDKVTITTPAYPVKTKFGVKRHVGIKIGNKNYTLALNKLSLTNLVSRLGSDSSKWVGQTATIRLEEILGKQTIVVE